MERNNEGFGFEASVFHDTNTVDEVSNHKQPHTIPSQEEKIEAMHLASPTSLTEYAVQLIHS